MSERDFRSGGTKELHVVLPTKKWVAHPVKLVKDDFIGAKGLVYRDGQYFFAGQRNDGLWVASRIIVKSGLPDELVCGKPYRQILGHTVAGGRALYVAFPNSNQDNFPRVVWGTEEGKPYEAIDCESLSLFDNAVPLYSAWRAGKTFVVRGMVEGKPYDEILGNLTVVATRVLYRARLGKDMFLVWGNDESESCDDISSPEFTGKEIVAWGTKNRRLCRLTIKVAT